MNLNENMIFFKHFQNIFLNMISDLKIWHDNTAEVPMLMRHMFFI